MNFRLVEEIPTGASVAFSPLFYNKSSFLKANNDLPQVHYYWLDTHSKIVTGHVAFSLEEGEAISPVKAPFGGIEYSEQLKYEELCTFVIFIERALKEAGIQFLRIHQPPENYQDQSLLNQILMDLDYQAKRERVHHGIQISEAPLVDQMAQMEQRRFRKCFRAGFVFKALESNDLPEVYRSIRRWREFSKKPLSMSWEELQASRKSNPKSYLPFGVFDGKRLVAATIAIQAKDEVLYHFYPAHDPEYNNHSPMVFLVNEMYSWCQKHEVKLLDLGTSYLGNKMNRTLIRFKTHLGAEESRAKIFRKALSSG